MKKHITIYLSEKGEKALKTIKFLEDHNSNSQFIENLIIVYLQKKHPQVKL